MMRSIVRKLLGIIRYKSYPPCLVDDALSGKCAYRELGLNIDKILSRTIATYVTVFNDNICVRFIMVDMSEIMLCYDWRNKQSRIELMKDGETVTTIEAVVSEKEIEKTLRKIVEKAMWK